MCQSVVRYSHSYKVVGGGWWLWAGVGEVLPTEPEHSSQVFCTVNRGCLYACGWEGGLWPLRLEGSGPSGKGRYI